MCNTVGRLQNHTSLSPDNALGPWADGTKLLVAFENSEGGVSHLDTVELALCLTHPAEQSGPPALSAEGQQHTHTQIQRKQTQINTQRA